MHVQITVNLSNDGDVEDDNDDDIDDSDDDADADDDSGNYATAKIMMTIHLCRHHSTDLQGVQSLLIVNF